MTNDYTPDCWVIVAFEHKGQTIHKIAAGWSGGYLDGDSWKLNSGITDYEVVGDYIHFHGYSGSVYKCRKSREGVKMSNAVIVERVRQTLDGRIVSFDEFNNRA